MKKVQVLAIIFLSLFLSFTVAQSSDKLRGPASGDQLKEHLTPSTENAVKPITFAVHPYLSATELLEKFTPLINYLIRETGHSIEISVSKTYKEHIFRVGGDKVDFAYMGPAPYVEMVSKYGRKPLLARLEVNGKPFFQGVIIVKKDSRIRTLADLAGRSFAFGDPNSTMSHLVPRYMLLKEGVNIEKLSRCAFMDNHVNVALGVLVGDYDAGAVKEEVFYKYEKRGLRELQRTLQISEHLFVATNAASAQKIHALREAMYRLKDSENGKVIISNLKTSGSGLVPVNDKDYDSLRLILNVLDQNEVRGER